MTRTTGALAIAALLLPAMAVAQVKTIQGETRKVTATVEAIDHAARTVTVKRSDTGTYVDLSVPRSAERFEAVKIGDKINLTYYENMVLRVQQPGDKPVDTGDIAATRTPGDKPGATVSAQRTVTVTISEIDMKTPSITFSGPNGWKYSSRVADKNTLSKVKVGDKVDITWTEAVLISMSPQ